MRQKVLLIPILWASIFLQTYARKGFINPAKDIPSKCKRSSQFFNSDTFYCLKCSTKSNLVPKPHIDSPQSASKYYPSPS